MNLLKSNNCWSCIPTAVSMVLDVSLSAILTRVGHDGSEIIWPQLPDPIKRKSFHIEEMQFAAFDLGWLLVPYYFGVHYNPSQELTTVVLDFSHKMNIVLSINDGILLGSYVGRPYRHAVAWNAKEDRIYDPSGFYSKLGAFDPLCFYAARRA